MTRLDNPRGLAFGLHGALFVAEAGRGGAVNGPCVGVAGFNCYGHTGAVSRAWMGRQDRVATGLPSIGFPQGASARGPHDIVARPPRTQKHSVLGEGGALVTVGLEKDASVRAVPGREDFAKLIHVPATTLYADPAQLCAHDCWSPVVGLLKLACHGRPLVCDTPPEAMLTGLDRATAILVERGGLYMSIRGSSAAFQNGVYTPQGEVIRIELEDDSGDEPGAV